MIRPRTTTTVADAPRAGTCRLQAGQSLVEFTLVLVPLMLLLLGIVQMGFVFNGYVTVSNAAREGARAATIYVYDRDLSKTQNDAARATAARTALVSSMGLLSRTSPQLVTGEQTIAYSIPPGMTESDTRVGQNVTVHAMYHMDVVIPFIGALLPLDDGRLALEAEVTMVIN